MLRPSVIRALSVLLKIAIWVVLGWAVYQFMAGGGGWNDVWAAFKNGLQTGTGLAGWAAAILLVALNWGIESYKWRYLLRGTAGISFGAALQAVLCGVAVSFFTPNRTGEFAGRVLAVRRLPRVKVIFLTLAGSFSQIVTTWLVGVPAAIWWLFSFSPWPPAWRWAATAGMLALTIPLLLLYFRLGWVGRLRFKHPRLQRLQTYAAVLNRLSYNKLWRIWGLSFLRYIVFTAQYLFLLQAVGITAASINMISMIALIFFVQMLVPSVAAAELGIRGGVSLYLFAQLTDNHLGVLTAGYSLWLLNLLLPALVGGALLLRINFAKLA